MNNRLKAWLWLVGSASTEITSSPGMRYAVDHHSFYIPVIFLLAISYGCLFMVMKSGMELGTAYALWGAVGVIATAYLSHLIYGELITSIMAFGMALIVTGVLTLEAGNALLRREGA